MLTPELHSKKRTVQNLNYSELQPNKTNPQQTKPSALLQGIVEGFVDGVLIVSPQGELILANQPARRFCRQITQDTSVVNVPQAIWDVCTSLLESREIFPDQKIILESEIDVENSAKFRLRVRWLDLSQSDGFSDYSTDNCYLLVTLEDRYQSHQPLAITESKKYGLTPRESEVWLLRRAQLSYKEIAAKLYITTNTVKKHLKNIYAKQQELHWEL